MVAHLFKWVCVWPQRRPGSLSTGAGGPMGLLSIRFSMVVIGVYYMSM